jgi:UDP-N-acetylglucosamine acyltransferase
MIHNSAIIHPSAKIASDVEIGPYSIIGQDTIIATGTKIGAHVVIECAEISKNCRIFSHATLGTAPQDLKYKDEKTKLIIGEECTIREFVTMNRGTAATGKTVIGKGCLFMAYSHVAHDCEIGDGVIMANVVTLGGHVEIGDFAVLGGLAAVHQFSKVGKLAMIGGGAMVSQDILPFVQAHGDRARLVGLNLVGLNRRGLSQQSIDQIKSAYRVLFLSGIPMEEAMDQLEATPPGTEVREMIDFIHASKRGIARPNRNQEPEEAL